MENNMEMNDFVQAPLDIFSSGTEISLSRYDDTKSIKYENPDLTDAVGWIPVLNRTQLGEGDYENFVKYHGNSRIYIDISDGNPYLVIAYTDIKNFTKKPSTNAYGGLADYSTADSTGDSNKFGFVDYQWPSNPSIARLPLSRNSKGSLAIKIDGEVYSLDAIDKTYTKKHSNTNTETTYKKAIHIAKDASEYIVCSTCKVSCDLGCSNDSVSEIKNACSTYGICTSSCTGTCKTTCTGGSTGTATWWECKPVGGGTPKFGCDSVVIGMGINLRFGGMWWRLKSNCFLHCGMTCKSVCDLVASEFEDVRNSSIEAPDLFRRIYFVRQKSSISQARDKPRYWQPNAMTYGSVKKIGTMCKNTCEGSCYQWCNLGCDTSCLDDNNCSYFAQAALPKPNLDSDVDEENIMKNANKECKWCKYTALLFPI